MTLLPIVQRELQVAARRRSTYYTRLITSLAALFVAGVAAFFSELITMGGGVRSASGQYVFSALSSSIFLLALLSGVFLAADVVSEERREGTLGFLFLTDLKGFDVVLGKFMAVGLNAFYGLLAMFPILSMCLMAGGTTPGEFVRMSLALINALLFSIAAGVWVSSRSESSNQAMAATVLFLAILTVLPPLLGISFSATRIATPVKILSMVSPYQAFSSARDAYFLFRRGPGFWLALGISQLAAWVFLAMASWRLPRTLERLPAPQSKSFWKRVFSLDFVSGNRRRQAKWMDVNPVLWLLEDSRRLKSLAWALSIIGSALLLCCLSMGAPGATMITYVAFPFYFLLKLLFVIQACRFFSDARRTGALELLCVTPISYKTIIRGQWMALRRIFLWPVVVLMATELVILLVLPLGNLFPMMGMMNYWFPAMAVHQEVNSIGDFWALGWLGMWLALTSKNPRSAPGLTILYGLVLPIVAVCVPTLAIDAIFIAIFRTNLLQDFRPRAQPRLQ